MRGHVDAETVAAFREGLLSGRKAARVAAHLSACPRCAEVDAHLSAVTAILAHTPAPPMPASLAARLDAALAAEIARAAAPASPAPASPAPGRGARRPAASRLSLRLVAATAAVVLLGGGGYVVSRVIGGAGPGGAASSAGAAEPHSAIARRPTSALAPETTMGQAGARGLPVIASGTRYRPGLVRAQVAMLLKRYPVPGRMPGTKMAPPANQATTFPQLAACVSRITGGGQPRLIDVAFYGTRPAAVIVLPVARTPMVRVWVVGTGCSAHDGDVIATFTLPGTA